MAKTKENILRYTAIAFAAVRLVNYFINNTILNYVGAILLLALMVQAFPRLNKTTKIVVATMFGIGAILLFVYKASFNVWLIALLKNANLATLFICVGMMSLPFFYEDYQGALKVVVQTRLSNVMGFCLLTAVLIHFLGVLISVSSMAVIYELMSPYAKLYKKEDDFLRSITRGYNTSGFWSAAWASTIILTSTLDVTWASIVPLGIGFAALMIAMDMGSLKIRQLKNPKKYQPLTPEPGAKADKKRITTMLILAVILIGSILLLSIFTSWDLLIIVPIVSICFPLLCGIVQKHMPEYKAGMTKYYNKNILKAQSQCAIFAGAGFLGKAMQVAGFGEALTKVLPDFLLDYPVFMIMAIMILLILPSLIGIHPSATGTAFVTAIAPAAVGLSTMTYVFTILTGWLIAIMISPFSANNLMLAGFTGRNSWDISKLNAKFAVVILVVYSILISIICPMLG